MTALGKKRKGFRPFQAWSVDKNQNAIVKALKQMGASVVRLHMVGGGCPDLLVGYRGINHVIEVKSRTGKHRDSQVAFYAAWKGAQVRTARSPAEALLAIGAIEESHPSLKPGAIDNARRRRKTKKVEARPATYRVGTNSTPTRMAAHERNSKGGPQPKETLHS